MNQSNMKPLRNIRKKRSGFWLILVFSVVFTSAGCGLFGSNSDPDDICEGIAGWADEYFGDVSRSQCENSPNGYWETKSGRCFCEGEF